MEAIVKVQKEVEIKTVLIDISPATLAMVTMAICLPMLGVRGDS